MCVPVINAISLVPRILVSSCLSYSHIRSLLRLLSLHTSAVTAPFPATDPRVTEREGTCVSRESGDDDVSEEAFRLAKRAASFCMQGKEKAEERSTCSPNEHLTAAGVTSSSSYVCFASASPAVDDPSPESGRQ